MLGLPGLGAMARVPGLLQLGSAAAQEAWSSLPRAEENRARFRLKFRAVMPALHL